MLTLSTLKRGAGLESRAAVGVQKKVITSVFRVAILVGILVGTLSATAQEPSVVHTSKDRTLPSPLVNPVVEQKIDALVRKMTLEEKVGQLVQYSVGQPAGPVSRADRIQRYDREGRGWRAV